MLHWIAEECQQLRAACISSFRDFDNICKKADRHMTEEQHENMSTAIEHAPLTYNALADKAIRRGIRRWKVLPKFHAFTHYYSSKTNLRAVHCYLDEDFVGRLKKLSTMYRGLVECELRGGPCIVTVWGYTCDGGTTPKLCGTYRLSTGRGTGVSLWKRTTDLCTDQ